MRKHRLRNRIKSLVGSHIDPDKDEELKGSNIETEDNYNKIIELLNEENQDDKNKLIGLIEEFHKRYQSIYERYDHITGKLKEKVRSKNENDSSSSSSSDTDSDDHSGQKKRKNGKPENEIYTEIEELKRKLAVVTEEKEAITSEFNESKLQADQLLEDNSKLLAKKKELETQLGSKIEEFNRERTRLMSEIEEEKRNNEELRAETEIENVKEAFSETTAKLKILEDEVSNVTQILETTEAEKKSLSEELLKQREIHESFKNETEIKITGLEEELGFSKFRETEIKKQKEDEIKHLQVELANKAADQQKLLEETVEDLKNDLEIKGDEITSLTETVRNLEVKIRLANQKLHVTEQMLTETELDHTRREKKLHQENESLTEKISTLSETIVSVKKSVQEKVNEMSTIIDSLTVKFDEDYGHVMTRVNEIANEIGAVVSRLNRSRFEKRELKRELEETVRKVEMGEAENEKMVKLMEEMSEKIEEMEKKIDLKDEEMMKVVEDKMEVIRQLCLWADYQRDRCDRLHEILVKTGGGGGPGGGRRQSVR